MLLLRKRRTAKTRPFLPTQSGGIISRHTGANSGSSRDITKAPPPHTRSGTNAFNILVSSTSPSLSLSPGQLPHWHCRQGACSQTRTRESAAPWSAALSTWARPVEAAEVVSWDKESQRSLCPPFLFAYWRLSDGCQSAWRSSAPVSVVFSCSTTTPNTVLHWVASQRRSVATQTPAPTHDVVLTRNGCMPLVVQSIFCMSTFLCT